MAISLYEKLNNTPYDNEIALSEGDKTLTFSELKERVRTFANNLRSLGVKSGDVVTVCLPNVIEAVIAFYGTNASGCIANMVHPSLPSLMLKEIQESTHSSLLIGLYQHKSINKKITCRSKVAVKNSWDNFISLSSPTIEYKKKSSTAVFIHSGGTTDKPKTIVLSDDNFNALSDGLFDMFQENEARGYRALTTLPMFHGFGLGAGVHAMLNLGVELVLVPKFDKSTTPDLVLDKKINMILGVPLIFSAILNSPKIQQTKDLSFVKNCYVGGDNIPHELTLRFNELLKSKKSSALLCEGYGLTECVSVCAVNRNDHYKAGSIGLPLKGVELAILSENGDFSSDECIGEICVSGDIVMQRYLSRQNKCFMEKEGKRWLKTGDFGYRDADGFYYFVERKKRIVKISGVTVFPSEVEMILHTHHGVRDVFVKPTSKENQKLKAFVVKNTGTKVNEAELLDYCRAHLMKWAVPESIVFLSSLPLTPIGKIDKKSEIFN